MGDSYESFYAGGPSSWSPTYGANDLASSHISPGSLASTTSPQTANQITEVISRIKEGVKHIELQPLAGDVFDQIPTQHWEEMRAIMKLTGVSPSVHSPITNPAGFGQQGWGGEEARQVAEEKFFSVMKRSQRLDPDGNIPIVFHSTEAVQGKTYLPGDVENGEKRFREVAQTVVDKETGGITVVKEHRIHRLGESEKIMKEGGGLMTSNDALKSMNSTQWDKQINEVLLSKRYADESFNKLQAEVVNSFGEEVVKRKYNNNAEMEKYEKEILSPFDKDVQKTNTFLENTHLKFSNIFDTAYKNGSLEQKEVLKEINKNYINEKKKVRENLQKEGTNTFITLQSESNILEKYLFEINNLVKVTGPPKQLVDLEEFALDKSAKTFGNVAWRGFEEFGEHTPITAIENMYQGMPFSKAEDMKKLVEESRNVFVENALKSGKLTREEAKEQAEKLIGVTWDVGHLNLMKKSGFDDKDVIQQSKVIAPYVKHIHLTDNFGHSDSHLAPGMGNVPIKKILEELEKKGDVKGMKKVIEAGALVMPQSGLGMNPLAWTLKAAGSPIYGMKAGGNWSQASGMMGNYFSGYGFSNPSLHHSMYGAGFTTLPMEFGGNIPGTQSRFSGTPNA